MTLPARIRGPRGKAQRIAGGYDVAEGVPREPKVSRRSPGHCNFVRDHDCCVPGCAGRPIEVMHVRTGTGGGMGLKPSDRWTISGCQAHHAEQHRIGEASFERRYGVDMKALAREFVKRSPHRAKLEQMP